MLQALKVKLMSGSYANGAWEGVIEIHSSSTLEELHLAIQKATNFDNDHMYQFYIARTERSRERVSFDDESLNKNRTLPDPRIENVRESYPPVQRYDGFPKIHSTKSHTSFDDPPVQLVKQEHQKEKVVLYP